MGKTIIMSPEREKLLRISALANNLYELKEFFLELDITRGRLEEFREANKKLHEAFMRIRQLLGAWDTPEAPTTEQITETVERRLMETLVELEQSKKELTQFRSRVAI